MHPAVRVRVLLARHPVVYWLAIGALAVAIAVVVHQRSSAVERSRAAWGTTRTVLVADADQEPDQDPQVSAVELPTAMLPPTALHELPRGARLRQRVAAGEVLVAADITASAGPASRARPGEAVVGIVDPMSPGGEIGVAVQLVGEGVTLAERATIVELVDDVVFVAVAADRAPLVAAAAQQRLASIVFLP
jgi:hypothetical protein